MRRLVVEDDVGSFRGHVVRSDLGVGEAMQEAIVDVADFPGGVQETFGSVQVRQTEPCAICDSSDELCVVEEGAERGHLGVKVRALGGGRRMAGELVGLVGEEKVRELGVQKWYHGHLRDDRRKLELRPIPMIEEPDRVDEQDGL